jgi:hypothetical protein
MGSDGIINGKFIGIDWAVMGSSGILWEKHGKTDGRKNHAWDISDISLI